MLSKINKLELLKKLNKTPLGNTRLFQLEVLKELQKQKKS